MNAKELRGNNLTELDEMLSNSIRELVTVRMQKAMSQSKQTHLKRKLRRDIARIKTVCNELKQDNANE